MQGNIAIAVSGKDPRSMACAQALRDWGYQIESCPTQADVIVLPMGTQATPELMDSLRPGQLVLGGCLRELPDERFRDYYADPILQAANAVPTAEGAIGILMERLPITIQGMRCLITGYGRIGTVLSQKLALLGAKVTVSARRDSDLGKIAAMGLRPERSGCYCHCLGQYDAIINTVPSPVFSDSDYVNFKKDCLLLELASAPGGFAEEKCVGLNYVRAPGLPGRCAPQTAGLRIAEAVRRILDLEESSCDMKP